MSTYPGFLIREGARGDYVRQIQTCLNRVNNAGLNTDGIFGPLTRAAVVNYQRANGLAADGIVGDGVIIRPNKLSLNGIEYIEKITSLEMKKCLGLPLRTN